MLLFVNISLFKSYLILYLITLLVKIIKERAGENPTTLNLIYPEVYLGKTDAQEVTANINNAMQKYVADGIFEEYPNALIYVERTQRDGKVRCGIVGAVDLDALGAYTTKVTKTDESGTEVETKDGLFIFQTTQTVILKSGQLEVSAEASCETPGSASNNYIIGSINNLITRD